jgi:hypothetical protein
MKLLLHLLTSLHGTKRTSRHVRYFSAFGAKRTLTEPRREQPKIVNPRKQWQPLMNSAMLAARSDQGERR